MYRFLFVLLAACATTSATSTTRTETQNDPNFNRSVYSFPTRDDVSALRNTQGPNLELFGNVFQASEWVAVTEPIATTTLGEHETESMIGARVVALANSRPDLRATDAMSCFAKDVAAVFAEHGAQPDAGYQRYLASRCGAIMPELFVAGASGTAPTEMTEEALYEAIDSTLAGLFEQLGGLRNAQIGAHLIRLEENVAYIVAGGTSAAEFNEVRPTANENHVVRIRGRVAVPADYVGVAVNHGLYGYEPCALNHEVALPNIDAMCRMHPEDPVAALDVYALREGQMLGIPIASFLARHAGADGYVYRPTSGGNPVEVSTPVEFAAQLVERVNAVRAAANQRPLEHAVAQSAAISELAGTFFTSRMGGDLPTADRVSRAVIAGWDVDAPDVRDGSLTTGLVAGPRDPAHFLSNMLARPSARYTLLNPDARILAVGSILGEGGVAVMATTYERFADQDRAADARAIIDRITAARAGRNLPAPTLVTQWDGLREHMDGVREERIPCKRSTKRLAMLHKLGNETYTDWRFKRATSARSKFRRRCFNPVNSTLSWT